MQQQLGKFYLVSIGIGDPDNMTIRARNIIEEADVIFAMEFIQQQYSDFFQGKEVFDASHGLFTVMSEGSQMQEKEDKTRKIIRDYFQEGKMIVVIDFGDPTIYSPQSGYLNEFSDLSPTVIPGISSFNAANAAIGKELTGKYDRAVILTEALKDDGGNTYNRFQELAKSQSTLIVFTMKMDLNSLVTELKKHYKANTQVAVVVHAGFKDKEKVVYGTLDTIIDIYLKNKFPWDHLLYVGDFISNQ